MTGNKSELFPCVHAGDRHQYSMRVEKLAGSAPGTYVLQATMVQEFVGWFEDVQPDFAWEFAVVVSE